MPHLPVQCARQLCRLHQLRRRCLVPVVACQPQGRAAVLYVCVCKCITARMHVWGGQEDIQAGKRGRERLNGGNILQCTSFSSVYRDLYLFLLRFLHLVYIYISYISYAYDMYV